MCDLLSLTRFNMTIILCLGRWEVEGMKVHIFYFLGGGKNWKGRSCRWNQFHRPYIRYSLQDGDKEEGKKFKLQICPS